MFYSLKRQANVFKERDIIIKNAIFATSISLKNNWPDDLNHVINVCKKQQNFHNRKEQIFIFNNLVRSN